MELSKKLAEVQELEAKHLEIFRELEDEQFSIREKLRAEQKKELDGIMEDIYKVLVGKAIERQKAWLKTLEPALMSLDEKSLGLKSALDSIDQSTLTSIATAANKKKIELLTKVPENYSTILKQKFVVPIANPNTHNYPLGVATWIYRDSGGTECKGFRLVAGRLMSGNLLKRNPLIIRPATIKEVEKYFSQVTHLYEATEKIRESFSIFNELDLEEEKEEDLSPE